MALTVDVKDVILWPITALLIGVLLGLRVKRYLGKGRKVLELQERQSRLGAKFAEAQDRFAKATKAKPYANYTIAHHIEQGDATRWGSQRQRRVAAPYA